MHTDSTSWHPHSIPERTCVARLWEHCGNRDIERKKVFDKEKQKNVGFVS